MAETGFLGKRKKLDWKLVVGIVLFHLLVLYGLARALVPEFTANVIEQATSIVTVTVRTAEPEAEPSIAPPQPDEGAAGEEGREATAREVTAPEQPLPRPSPAPRASSTGTANASGARREGEGTGAGGNGDGTGSGRRGSGSGGAVAVGPSVRSGELNEARDFPVPEGGRQARFGGSVTVHFTVTTDGRARNCSVASSSVDAATTAQVCPLVVERIRFNPATTAEGTPVEARYGYRVDFRARS
ncbi:TonB family protein [Aurantiacibacter sediminis]|uniref:TonB family protein n=1 Tax=Aurantiacibacter sediminis TaxID=2793064 RepID=A0ABS0N176_9SPHN|nr:TonB family protein [Aurantiacibacter sediminis]MBH5321722.1 TonB family protein [Aurantiacibacter sediminis]